jgi:AmmeMemoRadiSam system protein B
VYARVDVPQDVVLLCFNHRGRGQEFGVWPEGAWRTPLGDVPVNADLSRRIKEAFAPAAYDEAGFLDEHSGEVQVPFLQRVRPDVRLAPVALSVGLEDRDRIRDFGRALATVEGDFLVVASTDLNHYEDQASTLEKDNAVIRAIEALDEIALASAIRSRDISMCGYAPTIATIAYAKAKGAAAARTIMHATSGDVSGDYDRVVGYAGMIIPCGN